MKNLKVKVILLLLLSSASINVNAQMITEIVDGMDNLYFTDWGHIYPEALGTGQDVTAVESGGSAFNFSGAIGVNITASGHVVDNGMTATDANGDPNMFMDGNFRGLPVYSLIGIWSSTANEITPIGDPLTAPFFIGTALMLSALDIPNSPNLFLFLAENDGLFADNSGYYDVYIDVQFVPIPASGVLLLSGLLTIFAARARSHRKELS